MSSPDADGDVPRLVRLQLVLDDLSTRERLDVLTLAWLVTASGARTEALIVPGGFPEERGRQVDLLHKIADLVAADEPDLEMERLYQEGDLDGLVRRLADLADQLKRDADDPETGGAA